MCYTDRLLSSFPLSRIVYKTGESSLLNIRNIYFFDTFEFPVCDYINILI